jgi:hypothetical protein
VGAGAVLLGAPLEQQAVRVMPRAVEARHAEGGGAHPKEATVCDDVHCRRGVPCVPDAKHVVEETHDEQGCEAAGVCEYGRL